MADDFELLRAALADRYALGRELGRGGMSTVYIATDLRHGRDVAIKVLAASVSRLLGTERFLGEIRISAGLTHPNILPLHDSGDAAGLLFYVMPYVDGPSLRDRLEREKRLSVKEAVHVVTDLADGLEFAHRRGIVHLDVKPENVLLEAGHAILADFGIARAVSVAGAGAQAPTGFAVGTPAYMSPEACSSEPAVDGRSDQYSLACVLYEMLAGQPPFVAATAQAVVARHLYDEVPPLGTLRPEVHQHIVRAVHRALAKDPADRFPTLAAFAEAVSAPPEASAEEAKSIAVLPFVNMSPNPDDGYLGDGLTEALNPKLRRS